MRVKAAAAVAALLLIACSGSSSMAVSSSARTSAPSVNLAGTKAADFRTRLDLLLGEQVLMVAKETSAAAGNTDEYPGYVALLASNSADLEDTLRLAFGNTAAQQVAKLWSEQDRDLVEYAVGLVTHKQSQAELASADLSNSFATAFSNLVAALTQLAPDDLSRLISQQLTATLALIGDIVGAISTRIYADLHAAHAQASRIGDLLADRIVQMFPDKFPGDPSLQAVTLRAALNASLQEQAYVTTFATEAVVRGRSADAAAASAALAAISTSVASFLTQRFGASTGKLWLTRDSEILSYAASVSITREAVAQSFVSQLAALTPVAPAAISDELDATLSVIDEQRAKSFTTLAADDRAAATAMQPLADALSAQG